MEISVQLSFVSSILLLLCTALPLTHQELLKNFCMYERGNFTAKSSFSSNLDRLYSTLSSAAPSPGGFYNISLGETPNQVNSLALCRGDVASATCLRCIANATSELRRRCPNQKEAIIWYDECMFRYSNRSIFGSQETGPYFFMWNMHNVTGTDIENFNRALSDLMDGLRTRAAGGGSARKFATGNSGISAFQKVYALVQCTPDLSQPQCDACLLNYIQLIPTCCNGRIGGRVIGPSCNFRYETGAGPFYDPSAEAPSSSSSPPPLPSPVDAPPAPLTEMTTRTQGQGGKSNLHRKILIIVAVLAVAVFLFLCGVIFILYRVRKPEQSFVARNERLTHELNNQKD